MLFLQIAIGVGFMAATVFAVQISVPVKDNSPF